LLLWEMTATLELTAGLKSFSTKPVRVTGLAVADRAPITTVAARVHRNALRHTIRASYLVR
jgi:hypothetical protein